MKVLHIGLDPGTVEFLDTRCIHARRMDATTLEDVPEWIESDEYDAVVVSLDACSFGNVLPEFLRTKNIKTPLIIVAQAHVGVDWHNLRASFLESGCDDVLQAPLHARELVATLHAVVRRSGGRLSDVITVTDGKAVVSVNLTRATVAVNGLDVYLSAFPMKVLLYIAMRRGRIVSRNEIIQHIYADIEARETNTVEVFIGIIRKKFNSVSEGASALLQTRKGLGYVLDSTVAESATSAA